MNRTAQKRMPAYFAGLLLSLGAMLVIMQAKRAFMPRFHEQRDSRAPVMLGPGGKVRLAYTADPTRFLIPGLPSRLMVAERQAAGLAPVIRMQYGELVNLETLLGPLPKEGQYVLEAELYVCAGPGAADCSKLLLEQPLQVKAGSPAEARVLVDLPKLAEAGLAAGRETGEKR